jgi:ankyrin repeat protein
MLLQEGWSPLHIGAMIGDLEVVRQLLGAGAAVDAVDKVRPPFTGAVKEQCEW